MLLALLVVPVMGQSPAEAAPPANDPFAGATPLAGSPGTVAGSNVEATKETGEPNHQGGSGGASIWYAWSPPADGEYRFDTCGSSFDSLVGVYTGATVDTLTPVGQSDFVASCNFKGRVTFTASTAITYHIAIDGHQGATGSTVLSWSQVIRPPNDNLAAAEAIPATSSGTLGGSNVSATKELGEPNHAGKGGGASIWYVWTPPVTGIFTFDTCGSSFDTLLAVYTGTAFADLVPVVSNDDGGNCFLQSQVTFKATQGVPYRIAVDGFGASEGDVVLNWAVIPPPANDDLAGAQPLPSAAPGSIVASNVAATKEAPEADHAGQSGGSSIWYAWTPPLAAGDAAEFAFDTCGSDFDTVLAVYEGTTYPLGPVASNNDAPVTCGLRSRVIFVATGGHNYRIAVDGVGGASGITQLSWAQVIPPPNDNLAAAQDIASVPPTTTTGSSVFATKEPNENAHAGDAGGASVWYDWTAPADGTYRFDTCLSNFDTLLAVYTGDTFPLPEVASNDDGCGGLSIVTFVATAGTTYHVAVDGKSGAAGNIMLSAALVDPPLNDDFADAQVLSVDPPETGTSVQGSNLAATKEANEPDHAGEPGGASIWYVWTAPASAEFQFDTCFSVPDTVLAVYTGPGYGNLTEVATNDDSVCGLQSTVRFTATMGTTYHISIDGKAGATGDTWITWAQVIQPLNDDLAQAEVLPVLPGQKTGVVETSNVFASKETNENDHAGNAGGASI